jgi:diguanylate cyclase (GGDEF)-like protein/PAS domain S-box-containing protein
MTGGGPAHAQLEAIMACVSGGVAVAGAGGRVLEANERWCEIVGQAPGEIVGRPWDAPLHSDDRGLTAAPDSAPARPVEVRVLRPGGEVRWAVVTLRAVSGEPATVVALEDITEAKRWDTERAALHRVAEAVGRGEEPDALLSLVAEEMAWLVNADGAGIVVFEGADQARIVGWWAIHPELIAATPDFLPLEGEGAAARVFATGRTHRTDRGRMTGGRGAPVPWRYSVAAPIRVEGRLWGALGAVSMEGTGLSDDAEERIARFAELVGVAIANTEARELLVRQASTDPLTGLAHHGAFHEALADEARRAERYGHPLSLAVIDLDHFKAVNDAHGHSTGDNVLREVAGRLRIRARSIDVTGRLGGEEFAWLMPETDVAGAAAGAERLRAEIRRARIGPVERLTASFGVAELMAGDEDGSDLFRRADTALYRAKHNGRDRTEAAVPPSPPVA